MASLSTSSLTTERSTNDNVKNTTQTTMDAFQKEREELLQSMKSDLDRVVRRIPDSVGSDGVSDVWDIWNVKFQLQYGNSNDDGRDDIGLGGRRGRTNSNGSSGDYTSNDNSFSSIGSNNSSASYNSSTGRSYYFHQPQHHYQRRQKVHGYRRPFHHA